MTCGAFLEAFGILAARPPKAEADDAIATLATREEAGGGKALVLTSDRDAFQLVSKQVTVVRPVKGVSRGRARRSGPGASSGTACGPTR